MNDSAEISCRDQANHSWILTNSGKRFSLTEPNASQVFVEDIAMHLSQLGRFTGATVGRWTILHHEILVAMLLRKWGQPASVQLAGLHHDSPEAYVNDNNSPLKREMRKIMREYESMMMAMADQLGVLCPTLRSPYDVVEERVGLVVFKALGLPDPFPHDIVKKADLVALTMEERDFMPVPEGGDDRVREPADPWHCREFLSMGARLVGTDYVYTFPQATFLELHKELHRQMIHEKMAA
jgi:hypothetical protein